MDSNQLITFANDKIGEVRGFLKDGEPWFLAGSVCRSLGIKNTKDAIAGIEERYRVAGIKGVVSSYTLLDTGGGKQRVLIIPEAFLYELIFQSRKQKAILFRAWVTSEVLPALRKHGEYRMSGKLIRRSLTDELVASGEHDRMRGHGISTYSALINKSLGLPPRNNRDMLDDATLQRIADREDLVRALIHEGRQYECIKRVLESLSQ